MSRLGKRPILIPKGVEVQLSDGLLRVKGPRGELTRKVHPNVNVDIAGESISVSTVDRSQESKALHGLFGVLVSNMVTGVTKGFEKALDIVGVGYKAELKGRTAVLNLGFSHPIHFDLPEGIDAKIEKTRIVLTGASKELLGVTAAKLRGFRSPEPYKGKGIRYANEKIRKKAGKARAK